MSRISKRNLDKELEERIFEIFWDYLATLTRVENVQEFLHSLLSYNEQITIAKRLAIAVLLKRDFNYEEIDDTLKVSKSTIGTVHKQLLIGDGGYHRAVTRILSKEKTEKIINKIDNLLSHFSLPSYKTSWKGRGQEKSKMEKRKRQLDSL